MSRTYFGLFGAPGLGALGHRPTAGTSMGIGCVAANGLLATAVHPRGSLSSMLEAPKRIAGYNSYSMSFGNRVLKIEYMDLSQVSGAS